MKTPERLTSLRHTRETLCKCDCKIAQIKKQLESLTLREELQWTVMSRRRLQKGLREVMWKWNLSLHLISREFSGNSKWLPGK
jgi:hypothetical protein